MNARADAAAIVEFFDVPGADAFDVPPEEAIKFFKAKGLEPSFSYGDMVGESHDHAFTVAKMMNVDMLAQVRASLDSAMAVGQPFKEWADGIIPTLQSGGWWGRKKVVDPMTGRTIVAQLGSPWRLETIFRTNMQSAYAVGHWQEIEATADIAPFLMYDAVDDLRTRPLHASWDRKVLPAKSAWWKTHFPPNGYNCRCGVIQLSADELEALNLTPELQAPDDGSYLWTNPRTGYALQVPKGIDPGFDRNPGQTMMVDVAKVLAEKIDNLSPSMKAAANSGAAAANEAALKIAIKQVQTEVAKATGAAALQRAMQAATNKAKQFDAQLQLDAIAGGKDTAGKFATYKIKALQLIKDSNAAGKIDQTPLEMLGDVLALADELKAKAELSSKLSLYKKAILDGKVPAPAVVKAFDSMPDADKAAFLAKIDAEKAAAEAKKQAASAAAIKGSDAGSKIVTGTPPDPAKLIKIGEQRGSNPGGTYQDTETGLKWYVKQPSSLDAARNEVLAGKLYELAGVEVPEMHMITLGGRPSIASRIVDDLKKADPPTLAAAPGAAEGFAVDAWLANWDVVGLGYDNLLTLGARAFRVDTGGALRYRAQGTLKGGAFGPKVAELDTLRSDTNRQSQSVFGSMTAAQIESSVERVLRISEEEIRGVIEQFGPIDAAERRILSDTMIARRRDLAERYPAAAARARGEPPAAPSSARVTAEEQAEIERSRVNGYTFSTDSGAIEDNSVIVHTYQTSAGADMTRAFFKLTPDGSAALRKAIGDKGAATAEATEVKIEFGATAQAILSTIKSINYRIDQGKPLDSQIATKLNLARAQLRALQESVKDAAAVSDDPIIDIAKQKTAALDAWVKSLDAKYLEALAGTVPTKVGQFFPDNFPTLGAALRAKPAAPVVVQAAGLTWKRIDGDYKFKTAEFTRGFAKENGGTGSVYATNVRFEATLPDGTKITYLPDEVKYPSKVVYAMQGVVQVDTVGKSIAATTKIFDAIDRAGIKATRATELDRKHLYLNSFARLQFAGRRAVTLERYRAIKGVDEAALQEKLGLLKSVTGVDVEQSAGYREFDGQRQAFGHGRAYQMRPDLDGPDFREFERTHTVFHNPEGMGLGNGSGSTGVFEKLKVIIEGGGVFASAADRVRRGVSINGGTSIGADLESGGGSYLFTRVLPRGQPGVGLHWKPRILRRMDAITYDGDNYGRTTGTHIETNRLGQDVASLKSVARTTSNETIFKHGISIFDDLDALVLSSETEVKSAIAWLKSKGYNAWPDGRPLEQVVMSKAKRNAGT